MKHNITIFLSVLLLLTSFSSCNSTKYVPKDRSLLTKNKIKNIGEKIPKENENNYIIQKPNVKLLGLRFKLGVYNLGKKDFNKKWDKKIENYKKDSTHFFTKVFSYKQALGYADFRKDLNNGFFSNGEPPVILNSIKAKKSAKNLKLLYIDYGYFKAKVAYKIDSLSEKKSKVTYTINSGKPYSIDSIIPKISSPILVKLYEIFSVGTLIKKGDHYNRMNIEDEANRLTKNFRNAGVYHFSKSSINFFDIDSLNSNYKTNIIIDIADRLVEDGDTLMSIPYKLSYIKQVKVYTDYSYLQKNKSIKDSVHYQGIDFYAFDKLLFKPKHLQNSIFLRPKQLYSDHNNNITRRHLRELSNFKSIRIDYEEVENNQLIATILLTPKKRYESNLENELTHSNQKPFGISGKYAFTNNNTFQGNEKLQFSLQGSFLNSENLNNEALVDSKFFNAWELGVDASYRIPRIFLPFRKKKHVQSRMSPKTVLTIGTSFQKNIGLDKRRFTAIAEYNWKANKKTNHKLELLNAQYIQNLNKESFYEIYRSERRKLDIINENYFFETSIEDYNVFLQQILNDNEFSTNPIYQDDYQTAQNIKKRQSIITEDILVPSLTYQLTHNTQKNFKDKDYSFFRARVSSAGLLSSLFAKSPDLNTPKQILGTNVAQYFKLDLQYRKHWDFDNNNIVAFRSDIGIAYPYGNSTSIPFSRSYSVGGPNDMRAWRIYELGPGSENSGLEFNIGNFKFISSIEYRFDILGSFKGAFFVDMGNIWDITNSELTSDKAKLNSLSSIKNIAIGSGAGIRYDFSFLVFRADLGIKTYEPYNEAGRKWFHKEHLKPVLNIGINYPF